MLLCAMLHHDELIRSHGARTNVPHLPASDEVMKRFHCLFDGGEGIKAVDLKEINVVRIQAFQRGVDCVEYRLAGQT